MKNNNVFFNNCESLGITQRIRGKIAVDEAQAMFPVTTENLLYMFRQVYHRRRSGRMRTKGRARNSPPCTLSHTTPSKKGVL